MAEQLRTMTYGAQELHALPSLTPLQMLSISKGCSAGYTFRNFLVRTLKQRLITNLWSRLTRLTITLFSPKHEDPPERKDVECCVADEGGCVPETRRLPSDIRRENGLGNRSKDAAPVPLCPTGPDRLKLRINQHQHPERNIRPTFTQTHTHTHTIHRLAQKRRSQLAFASGKW